MIKKFLSYLLRVFIFQLGTHNKGIFARSIVRLIKRHYDISYKHLSLNPENLGWFIYILEDLGGIRGFKTSLDGHAQLDYMLLTANNVKQRIEKKGGKWGRATWDGKNVEAIFADHETSEWKAFFEKTLSRFGWERVLLDGTKAAYITHRTPSKEFKKACFLRCHSPGRSYGMDQSYIGRHLSLHKDLCLFNYRGTHLSTGTPSEGGYYLDAETLYQELIGTYGYKPEEIWVTGFCLGGAVAAHVKAKYHDQGVHFSCENSFESLEKVIYYLQWPANILGKKAIDAIRSSDPMVYDLVHEDYFNTLKKFKKLKPNGSISIIIHTDHDPVITNSSTEILFQAAQRIGKSFKIVHKSDKRSNPHGDDVFADQKVWDEYIPIIS